VATGADTVTAKDAPTIHELEIELVRPFAPDVAKSLICKIQQLLM
jgi:hypothetical protein